MAKYLFTAPDDDMARWKSRAKELGLTFADFLREAAEARCVFPAKAPVKGVLIPPKPTSYPPPPGGLTGKKNYGPDPK